ncbi:hypothetical protein IG631_05522 [Alternaria alternata]|nr:hypothetical protein IG631_05522 [Alternaria alternata]
MGVYRFPIPSYTIYSIPVRACDKPNPHSVDQPHDQVLAVAPTRPLRLISLGPQINPLALLSRPQVPRSRRLINRQLLRNRREKLFNILRRLGRRFKEEQSGFFGVLLGVGRGNGALIGGFGDEIEFVTREGDDDVFVGLALEFFYPGFCFV